MAEKGLDYENEDDIYKYLKDEYGVEQYQKVNEMTKTELKEK